MASNTPDSDTGSAVHRLASTRQRLNALARLRRSRAKLVAAGTPQPMRAKGAPTSHTLKTPDSLKSSVTHNTQVSPHTLNVSDSAPVRRVQAGPPRGVGVPEPDQRIYGLASPVPFSGAPVQGATRHSLGEERTPPLELLVIQSSGLHNTQTPHTYLPVQPSREAGLSGAVANSWG